jgi:hypothetical protein
VKRRRFFAWLLPLLWAPTSLVSYYHPGDEYGLYFISSLLGSWFVMIQDTGDIHDLWIPLSIAATGAAVCSVLGLMLDLLRVTRAGLLTCWAALAAFMVWSSFAEFPNVKEALGKNGSWTAYITAAMNTSLTINALVFAIGGALWRMTRGLPAEER